MIIKDVNLETVCGITSKLPANTQPEFAFAGKSNVGKSSLINALMNRRSYARILAAGQDPDDQFLPYQRRVLLRRSARVRLRASERRGQGKVGQDD